MGRRLLGKVSDLLNLDSKLIGMSKVHHAFVVADADSEARFHSLEGGVWVTVAGYLGTVWVTVGGYGIKCGRGLGVLG